MKNVVVIGGGTGQSVILKGIKNIPNINITTIVTVADDGGSTGRLRQQMNIPALGDIRNVMCALAKEETLFTHLMEYRFLDDKEEIGGHNLGNLILAALTETEGGFTNAISEISKVLNVKGTIIPSTNQVITLFAKMKDGTIVKGESNIPNFNNHIQEVFYDEYVKANPEAIKAIEKANIILIGIGSLYTSVIPCLIIKGICDAIKKSKAKKYYLCNVMTQPGETDYYSVEDHVEAIEKHTYKGIVSEVIVTKNNSSKELIRKYKDEGAYPVRVKQDKHHYKIIIEDLLNENHEKIRHDPNKIRNLMIELLNKD